MPTLEEVNNQISMLKATDTFGTKKEIKYLPEVLTDDECVLGLTSGLMDKSTWLIVCTPKRIILLDKGLLFGLQQKEFLLKNISSVEFKTGLLLGEIKLTVSSSSMTIKNIEKSSVKGFVEITNQAIKSLNKEKDNSPFASNEKEDLISKLKQLSELKENGILSETEFEKAKTKLLE